MAGKIRATPGCRLGGGQVQVFRFYTTARRGSGFRVSDDKRPGRTELWLDASVCSVRYALVLLVFE